MPKTAKVMHHGSLVRSLHHNIPEHGVGTQYMTTGNRPSPSLDYPGLGSLAATLLPAPAGVPSYVAFQRTVGAGYLGTAYAAFEVEGAAGRGRLRVPGMSLPTDFSLAELADRDRLRNTFDAAFQALDQTEMPASLDKFHQQALDILRSDKTRQAFDLDKEPTGRARRLRPESVRGKRPDGAASHRGRSALRDHRPGRLGHARQQFPDSARQPAAPVGRRPCAATRRFGGQGTSRAHARSTARASSTARRGSMAPAGRDHWARSMAVFLAGGGIRKGHVHGSTDRPGHGARRGAVRPDDVAATIFRRWASLRTAKYRP